MAVLLLCGRDTIGFIINLLPGNADLQMHRFMAGVDLAGNIYVSDVRDSHIRIYGPDGSLRGSFGRSGMEIGEFNSPAGLWIDGANRLYVSDTNNGRVQVFQLSHASESHTEAKATR